MFFNRSTQSKFDDAISINYDRIKSLFIRSSYCDVSYYEEFEILDNIAKDHALVYFYLIW